jgi:hypothetical protein
MIGVLKDCLAWVLSLASEDEPREWYQLADADSRSCIDPYAGLFSGWECERLSVGSRCAHSTNVSPVS